MQLDVTVGELLVIAAILILAFFCLIPPLTKGIVHRLKKMLGGLKDQD